MSIALAKSALPSARNSIASAPLAFFHSFMTKPSLTAVTAIVSMPFALMAAACFTKPGRWFLWQVGVKAPGTANSTTFLPLNSSSLVFGLGPSAVITVNVPLGTRSPTLIAMTGILSQGYELRYGAKRSAFGELVETKERLHRLVTGDRREAQRSAFRLFAGRHTVDIKSEPL